ncbi:MAG TPA: pyruvate kinase [Vicinamibacterales bacterium]|nr:pyruvate kinase [Vicinamibacterales bacterium]
MRRTRIIATVGPASDNDHTIDALIDSGVDVFRLNFSHGTHESQTATFHRIRAAAARAGCDVGILQDLGGPKIRTGVTRDGRPIVVKAGDRLRIVTGDLPSVPGAISTTFEGLANAVKAGDRLLIADGLIELRVEASDGKEIQTIVVEGGEIGDHKGINAPGVPLPASAITVKDADDLRLGVSLGVDMIALSFVQSVEDIAQARRLLEDAGAPDVTIVAKLERPKALEHLDAILEACDGVMVARGDLGLEMPLEKVPTAQKTITRLARLHGIPVIVATQVLESMTVEPRPTRAEVSDAANAVDDGVDAIMLAGETAVGTFPAKTVQVLDAIIREAETAQPIGPAISIGVSGDQTQALCEAAVTLASRGRAAAIVAITRGGSTARRLAALRPRVPIIAACERHEVARRLSLHWGVLPICVDIGDNVDTVGSSVGRDLVSSGLVSAGASVVLVSTDADLARTDANYLKVQKL